MKQILFIILTALISGSVQAQSPEAISYQAIARNAGGSPIINQNVSLFISIRTQISGGIVLYSEVQNTTTNAFGLLTINIGQGTPVIGSLSSINWNGGPRFLQVDMDPAGGSAYVNLGSQQLLSVPYALYAKSAGNSWSVSGNSGIAANQFLGTTDFNPLRFRVNNISAGVIEGIENNTSFGMQSLTSTSGGGGNTAIGFMSQNGAVSSSANTSAGSHSLAQNATGYLNTAIGYNTLQTLVSGGNCTAIGAGAMRYAHNGVSNTSISNTAVGAGALAGTNSPSANTGKFNTAVGVSALNTNSSGEMNTSVGVASLNENTTGSYNTVMGYGGFPFNSSGSFNTVIGAMTNQGSTGGNSNTIIGYGAQTILSNLTNATAIGANASVLTSNSLILGENANVGIGCNAPQYKLHVVGDIASSGTVRSVNTVVTGAISACSDLRFKKEIAPLEHSLEKILSLNGVNYFWKKEEFPQRHFTYERQIGLIAQEIEQIFPELVMTDADGYRSVDYSRLTPVLIEAIKELKKENDNLKVTLERELEVIRAQLGMNKNGSGSDVSVKNEPVPTPATD